MVVRIRRAAHPPSARQVCQDDNVADTLAEIAWGGDDERPKPVAKRRIYGVDQAIGENQGVAGVKDGSRLCIDQLVDLQERSQVMLRLWQTRLPACFADDVPVVLDFDWFVDDEDKLVNHNSKFRGKGGKRKSGVVGRLVLVSINMQINRKLDDTYNGEGKRRTSFELEGIGFGRHDFGWDYV